MPRLTISMRPRLRRSDPGDLMFSWARIAWPLYGAPARRPRDMWFEGPPPAQGAAVPSSWGRGFPEQSPLEVALSLQGFFFSPHSPSASYSQGDNGSALRATIFPVAPAQSSCRCGCTVCTWGSPPPHSATLPRACYRSICLFPSSVPCTFSPSRSLAILALYRVASISLSFWPTVELYGSRGDCLCPSDSHCKSRFYWFLGRYTTSRDVTLLMTELAPALQLLPPRDKSLSSLRDQLSGKNCFKLPSVLLFSTPGP